MLSGKHFYFLKGSILFLEEKQILYIELELPVIS